MSVDEKIIMRKITFINRDLKLLVGLSRLSFSEFLKKPEYEALAERYLERIIGRMIDINYHILSKVEKHSPLDMYNSFVDMGKKGYLSDKLADKLADSAGLRNRLTHEYDEIDEKKIYKAMKSCLEDVPKYLLRVEKLIGKKSKQRKLL
jgi:uncharacterized protein YutE (UPF0331/DUF86 family)